MTNHGKKPEPWEVIVALVITAIGVLASIAFPPLWIVYLFCGCFWLSYQGAKSGRKE